MSLADVKQHARAHPLWALAFVAALLLPVMLVVARAGIEVCGGVIILGFLWHSYRTREWAWARTPLFRIALLLWAWLVLIVSPLAYFPDESLPESLAWIRFVLLFMALRYWVFAPDAARRMAAMFTLGVVTLVALDMLWQYMSGVSLSGNPGPPGRLSGPFDTPKAGLLIGKLVIASGAVAWGAALISGSGPRALLPLAMTLFVLATLLLTGDIAATLAAFFALAVLGFGMMLKRPSWRKPCLALGAVFVLAATAAFMTQPTLRDRVSLVRERLSNYSASDYGVIVHATIAVGKDHLLHGAGVQNFRDISGKIAPYETLAQARHPHHYYLEWWVEAGIPGLLLFCALVIALLREGWTHWRRASGLATLVPAAACAVTLQHFLPLLTTQSAFNNWSAMLVWFSLGLVFASLPHEKPRL